MHELTHRRVLSALKESYVVSAGFREEAGTASRLHRSSGHVPGDNDGEAAYGPVLVYTAPPPRMLLSV